MIKPLGHARRLSNVFAGSFKPVIPFLTAGFPNRRVFANAVRGFVDAGAGALEIGMPFSDPIADGPVIQHSSSVALHNGVTTIQVLELAAETKRSRNIPLLLMGSLNPMLRYGLEKFIRHACQNGVDGLIVPDCPPEEGLEFVNLSKVAGISNVFLMAPTSPDERIRRIDRMSTHFSYCIAVAGTTGARGNIEKNTLSYLKRVRRLARKPYVVGFGISRPEHITQLWNLADGFVVGSALVSLLKDGASGVAPACRLVELMVRAAGN